MKGISGHSEDAVYPEEQKESRRSSSAFKKFSSYIVKGMLYWAYYAAFFCVVLSHSNPGYVFDSE